MKTKANTDLSVIPRPYTTIADLLFIRTGRRVSAVAIQRGHDRAMRKIRRELVRMGIEAREIVW
jgi:hypothetical protein